MIKMLNPVKEAVDELSKLNTEASKLALFMLNNASKSKMKELMELSYVLDRIKQHILSATILDLQASSDFSDTEMQQVLSTLSEVLK